MRVIGIYFLFLFCLLMKDGFSLAIDDFRKKGETAISQELALEDSVEEGAPEDCMNHAVFINVLPQLQIPNPQKTCFPERNESELNVLLEQISPPPRMA